MPAYYCPAAVLLRSERLCPRTALGRFLAPNSERRRGMGNGHSAAFHQTAKTYAHDILRASRLQNIHKAAGSCITLASPPTPPPPPPLPLP